MAGRRGRPPKSAAKPVRTNPYRDAPDDELSALYAEMLEAYIERLECSYA